MLTIANDVFQAYPQIKMGLLSMRNLQPDGTLSPAEITARPETLHAAYANRSRAELKAIYPLQPYVDYYKNFGHSYPVLAQLESVSKGKTQLHASAGLLQAMFLTELESMLLTAGHDRVKLRLPLQLQLAAGDESYLSIAGRQVTTVARDLMICDTEHVLSSALRGPDSATRITDTTTEALFIIYGVPGVREDTVVRALQTLETRIRLFSPAAETALLCCVGK